MICIASLLEQYRIHHPDEHDRLESISALVAQFESPVDLIRRSNFVGHVTASAFILSPDRRSVLLLAHRALGIYVQPGGHLDLEDRSPLDGAMREALEETGLRELELVTDFDDRNVPFDIDTHYIPQNDNKGEPQHWHHDLRYCFVSASTAGIALATDEVESARWVNLSELHLYPTLDRVAYKLGSQFGSQLGK